MTQDQLFQFANLLALIGWIILILSYKRPGIIKLLIGVVVASLCSMYAVLVFKTLQPGDFSKFSTLDGVSGLLALPGAALVGWIHYLAFDLMTGIFIAVNGRRHGVRFILLLPCMLCTFMLGPFGLLLYFVVRWHATGNYFANSFEID